MKEINVVIIAIIWALTFAHVAEAQTKKVPRLGFLFPGSSSYGAPNVEAFRQGLRELGYVQGSNILIEYREAGGKSDRYAQLAAELVDLGVDVLVTASTPAIKALKKATNTIPIVMAAAADPVQREVCVQDLRHGFPGTRTGPFQFQQPDRCVPTVPRLREYDRL